MRITEIIQPAEFPELSIENVKKFLIDNCSEILQIYNNTKYFNRLYRSTSYNHEIFVAKPWKQRIPLSTPIEIQNKIDDILKECGFSALRSNSIFCSGNREAAAYGGYLYIIYPFDGFTYTYAEGIADLTVKYKLFKGEIIGDPFNMRRKFIDDLNNLAPNQFVNKYKFLLNSFNIII